MWGSLELGKQPKSREQVSWGQVLQRLRGNRELKVG